MEIKVYRSIAEAEAVWRPFQQDAYLYAFQTYEWLSCWYEIIGIHQNVSPCIVVVRTNEDPEDIALLLPLGIQKSGIIRKLVWLGGDVSDYHGPIIGKSYYEKYRIDIDMLIRELKTLLPKFDVIFFEKQPAKIGNVLNPFITGKCRQDGRSYCLTPDTQWGKFFKTEIKSRVRNDTARQERRLAERGKLSFLIGRSEKEITEITNTMIQQKIRRLETTGVENKLNFDHYKRFYSSVALAFKDDGIQDYPRVQVSALYLNGNMIATHWGLIYKDRFYYLMPAYEEGEISKYSPGRLLMVRLLEWCFGDSSSRTFDFTVGKETYKSDWCNEELILYRLSMPLTLMGYYSIFNYYLYKLIRKNKYVLKIARIGRLAFRYIVLKNRYA